MNDVPDRNWGRMWKKKQCALVIQRELLIVTWGMLHVGSGRKLPFVFFVHYLSFLCVLLESFLHLYFSFWNPILKIPLLALEGKFFTWFRKTSPPFPIITSLQSWLWIRKTSRQFYPAFLLPISNVLCIC